MKYLIVLIVVFGVLWLVRSKRPQVRPPRPAPPTNEPMLACMHCGLHLPRGEALPGRGGVFCGEAHRTEYEKAHPLT
jgi:uncharacterized protein